MEQETDAADFYSKPGMQASSPLSERKRSFRNTLRNRRIEYSHNVPTSKGTAPHRKGYGKRATAGDGKQDCQIELIVHIQVPHKARRCTGSIVPNDYRVGNDNLDLHPLGLRGVPTHGGDDAVWEGRQERITHLYPTAPNNPLPFVNYTKDTRPVPTYRHTFTRARTKEKQDTTHYKLKTNRLIRTQSSC